MRRRESGARWTQMDVGSPRNAIGLSHVYGVLVSTPVSVFSVYPPERSGLAGPRSFRGKSCHTHRRRFV